MYRKVSLVHCFDHEIILEGMKEKISQQTRCTVSAHCAQNAIVFRDMHLQCLVFRCAE